MECLEFSAVLDVRVCARWILTLTVATLELINQRGRKRDADGVVLLETDLS